MAKDHSIVCAFTVLGSRVHTSDTLLKTSSSQPTHLNHKNGEVKRRWELSSHFRVISLLNETFVI